MIGMELGLPELIILGKGERQSGGATKPRLVASALEALLGAIYLDSNYESAFRVVAQFFHQRVKEQGEEADYRKDYKTRLQEVVQRDLLETPTYSLEEESGPPHDRRFKVSVRFSDRVVAFGEGKSKKQAEQKAAEVALNELLANAKDSQSSEARTSDAVAAEAPQNESIPKEGTANPSQRRETKSKATS
jgi:ribonuclease-3